MKPKQFVLDGGLVIVQGSKLSFHDLLLLLHPAQSRVRKLAAETLATLIAFDLLYGSDESEKKPRAGIVGTRVKMEGSDQNCRAIGGFCRAATKRARV